MAFLINLAVIFIAAFSAFAAIVWITTKLSIMFSINSLLGKSIILGFIVLLAIVSIFLIIYGSLDMGINIGLMLAPILTLFSTGAFWLSRRLKQENNLLIPVIILSCVFAFTLTFYNSTIPIKPVQVEEGAQSGANNEAISGYEKQVISIMYELERSGILSGLPKDYDKLLLGSNSSLTGKETLQFVANDKKLQDASMKAIGELDRRVGKETLLELMIASHNGKKSESFLDTAGKDYIGRNVFYSELRKRKQMQVK